MNDSQNGSERKLRKGGRVSLGGRVGVLRYFYGPDAAVVRFDRDATTKVVPLRRLVACTDERPLPESGSDSAEHLLPGCGPGRRCA